MCELKSNYMNWKAFVSKVFTTWVSFLSVELPALFEMAEQDDMDTTDCLKDIDGLEIAVDCTEDMEMDTNLLSR